MPAHSSGDTAGPGAAPAAFPRLFSPFAIRGLELRNRLVMTPMGTRLSRDGLVSHADIAWLAERARGGAGMIITGGQMPSRTAANANITGPGNTLDMVEAFRDDGIEQQRAQVQAVHQHGAKIVGQLVHPGRDTLQRPGWTPEMAAVAPSGEGTPGGTDLPHALSREEIAGIVAEYGQSARNLQAAGFDGIEIHAAHGYLVAQFLSPLGNHRDDEYGMASVETRMRFLDEILAEVRRQCGTQIIAGVRLSADEQEPGGTTLEDTLAFARRLEASGMTDYLSITVGIRGNYVKDHTTPAGPAVGYAAAVRSATRLPVIVASRITTPAQAERILADGAADLIGMGRALIADPRLPVKARAGQAGSIRPCVGFVQDCRQFLGAVLCSVNPSASRERTWSEFDIRPAPARRRIVIAGGGPGGLEAARLAAEYGHDVIVYEREESLGGQVRLAAQSPHREAMQALISYLEHEVRRLGVEVRIGQEAVTGRIRDDSPDVLVLATGARPPQPSLPGATVPVLTTWDVLGRSEPDGQPAVRHAIVADDGSGFWPACSAAERLADRGVAVELVTPAAAIGANIPAESIRHLHRRLRGNGVAYHPFGRLVSAAGRTAAIADAVTGEERLIETDLIVVQLPPRPVFPAGVADLEAEVFQIGDCVAPRRLSNAIFEASKLIRSLAQETAVPPLMRRT